MQNALTAVTNNCKALQVVCNNSSRNYRYMLQHKSHLNTMSQKQFNKTYAKHFTQFAKFPTIQKRIARAIVLDIFNQYLSTNQI